MNDAICLNRFFEMLYFIRGPDPLVGLYWQDYLRKISLKMLTMETKSQNPITNSIQPNPASSGQNALGPGSHSMQSQVNSQAQQLPVPMAQNTYAHQPPTMDSDGLDIASELEFDRLLSLID
ncbi:uncharacterized protein LOC129871592 isoform X2 [Solanum dulcamara]|uniref:uncharacterized protein LOC129871592 isoform X2 n=1 Tax=Solanum dulcamara TaxID=45834 RepID=UPI0024866CDD|nr:uncharacterized protein LOC129871592 isoform X2 [Solanum dulcamara]